MSLFTRSASPLPQAARRLRPAAPRCRGGVSSLLRLAPPSNPRHSDLTQWLSRAAAVFTPASPAGEFAPSRWLNGH